MNLADSTLKDMYSYLEGTATSRGDSRKQDRGVLNHWRALALAKFSAMPLNLTLVEELLNQVDSKQADLRAGKQLQTVFVLSKLLSNL